MNKDLRRLLGESVQGPFSRGLLRQRQPRRVPRRAAADSLEAALAVPKEQLYQDSGCTAGDETCFDEVRFRAIGAITVPSIPWINRPTYQQVVRGAAATGRASGIRDTAASAGSGRAPA